MPKKFMNGKGVDVRPDRIDFRDFPYQPPLRNLPHRFPDIDEFKADIKQYTIDGMILDQDAYGACTGFGLAAVINYLNWERKRLDFRAAGHESQHSRSKGIKTKPSVTAPVPKWNPPPRVSESMLYLNARLYDEWDGEDYEGSSCRGGMKGWHKHGVCLHETWPYDYGKKRGEGRPGRPVDANSWKIESGKMVLGAYYRVNAQSIVAMQAAIHEIHAVYCSADVHDGWEGLEKVKRFEDAVIAPAKNPKDKGGHAFAVVGYTPDGFIVQNSWGSDWGYKGFALLPYADWIENAYDAWALALGAPLNGMHSPVGQSRLSLQERTRNPAGWSIFGEAKAKPELPKGISQWTDDDVSNHVILSTIDGAPVRHLQDTHSAEECVDEVAKRALGDKKPDHIAIYIHGGLNGKDDGLLRTGFMGPWFTANGIIPFFPIWQTDAKTSILHALIETIGMNDLVKEIVSKGPSTKPDERAIDRHIEDLARHSPGKAAWTEMKSKAMGLSEPHGALRILLKAIGRLSPKSNVHLIGHSAGAIVACHALSAMKTLGLKLGTVSLYAPACTAALATSSFKSGYLSKGTLSIDYLSDRREQSDACISKFGVTVYSKSLLYLVSRALESMHKTPLLGLERTLTHSPQQISEDDSFNSNLIDEVEAWQAVAAKVAVVPKKWDQDKIIVTRGKTSKHDVTQSNIHGSFDNNVECVNATIRRIKGSLKSPVTDLNFGGG